MKTSSYGCSNLRGGEPNSAADIRNIELWMEENQVRVIWPDGIERVYLRLTARLYRLSHELLPNGKRIHYNYGGNGLFTVSSTDPSGQYIYASIEKVGGYDYRASNGTEAHLTYETHNIKGKIKIKKVKESTVFSFPVMTSASTPFYNSTVSYDERTLLTSYDARVYPISCSYFKNKGEPCRIQTFSTPSGSTTFWYDPPVAAQRGGSTTVTHPNGSQTVYRFNKELLLTSLENWVEGRLCNQKVFSYDPKQHLEKVETKDGSGKIHSIGDGWILNQDQGVSLYVQPLYI